MTSVYVPLAHPQSIRLLCYDGLHDDGKTPKFTLRSTSHEAEPVALKDSTVAQEKEQNIEKPRFYALSCVLDDLTDTESIYCNGACIQIARNLRDALAQISTQFPDRLLWVSAFCINQEDLAEKAAQEAMIVDIYHAAESVIIWLGRADGLSPIMFQSTIDNFIAIRSQYPMDKRYPACKKCDWTLFEEFYCKTKRHLSTAQKCPGLREITQKMGGSEWFNSIWTFQDLILASSATVHLGPFYMPWEFFVPAFEEFNRSHGCVMKGISRIDQLNDNIKAPLGSQSFAELLSATKDRKATIPQDRIYALMGIPTRVPLRLKRDYNMPLDQLYMAVTRFCIEEDNIPGILNSICPPWAGSTRMSNLPSWVVDFSTDCIKSGNTNLGFGQLPSLPNSELSLNMYCFVLGFYAPGDERFKGFQNWRSPDFRPLPHCVFSQLTSKTQTDLPRIAVSQPCWSFGRIANIDKINKLYDHYTNSSNLVRYLEQHISGACSCSAQTRETMPNPVPDKPLELACILVNQNGKAPNPCFAVQPITYQTFRLAGGVNWPALWPHGLYWVPKWKQRFRGKTMFEYSMVFTSVDLY